MQLIEMEFVEKKGVEIYAMVNWQITINRNRWACEQAEG